MISLDALKSLEKLSELGKKEKIISIGDIKITISTLDTGDETDVFVSCSELSGNAYFNTLKLATLKYAIRAVNGERLDSYLEETDLRKKEQARADVLQKVSDIVKKWDEKVVSFLYTEWANLAKESEDEIEEKQLLK